MINFKKQFQEMLDNDLLGILNVEAKESTVIRPDNRLKDSFEEINQFIDAKGHEPKKSRDINERKLFSRLQDFKQSPEKAALVLKLDKHNLLESVEVHEPFIIESIDDVLDADPLGLLGDINNADAVDIFDLKNLPSKSRASTDFMARRKPCENFEDYKDQLIKAQLEIKTNQRKLTYFTDKGDAIVEGNYYILGGILLYLDSIYFDSEEKTVNGKRHRKDGRTRCIFENGTESNMLYRSLAKALYQGGKIVTQTEDQINKEFDKNFGIDDAESNKSIVNEADELAGYIYILKSLSANAEIQSLEHLYKIGFSTTTVEKRISNAENEPTYLMAKVKIMVVFDAYNMSTQKFEKLIHRFFAKVCVDLKVADNKGQMHQPREWFIVPYNVIVQAINLIANEQIVHYRYDHQMKKIVAI